jgi:hypothetical protein
MPIAELAVASGKDWGLSRVWAVFPLFDGTDDISSGLLPLEGESRKIPIYRVKILEQVNLARRRS